MNIVKYKKFRKWIGIIGFGVLTVMLLHGLIISFNFYIYGEETVGIVTKIVPYNSYCGYRNRLKCTVYSTTIYLDKPIDLSYIDIDSFETKGHDQSISLAQYQVGDGIEIIVNRNELSIQKSLLSGIEIKEFLLRQIWIYFVASMLCILLLIMLIKSTLNNNIKSNQ